MGGHEPDRLPLREILQPQGRTCRMPRVEQFSGRHVSEARKIRKKRDHDDRLPC